MRRGFNSLSAQVESVLNLDAYRCAVYLFRGRRGDLLKPLYWDGQGLVLYAKRLEKGRFVWPQAKEGTVSLFQADPRHYAQLISTRCSLPRYGRYDAFVPHPHGI